LQDELYNTGLTFVCGKQNVYNLIEITTIVKDVILREGNMIANMSEKYSLTPYPEINFNWSKKSCIE